MSRLTRQRLDVLLVERGLAESRERARALVMAGEVLVENQLAMKTGQMLTSNVRLSVKAPLPYVSRGGVKLAHALDKFGIHVAGLTALDVGASTGGFTDVLLQRGASKVYAVDVGYGQFHWRLRNDARVVLMERTNIRHLDSLPEPVQLASIDVSFISLKQVLAPVRRLLCPDASIVALVKPQFEVGKALVGRGGVVRDPDVHRRVLVDVAHCALELAFSPVDASPSPILGPAGNREFLVYLRQGGQEALSPEQLAERAFLESDKRG